MSRARGHRPLWLVSLGLPDSDVEPFSEVIDTPGVMGRKRSANASSAGRRYEVQSAHFVGAGGDQRGGATKEEN